MLPQKTLKWYSVPMDLELLRFRARTLQSLRRFFIDRGYLELDTPALSADLIPETCLEVFKTDYTAPRTNGAQTTELYLVPSPEIYIKKIIARHKTDVFQISKCYRNAESCGRIHSPEFTMLEYYTMNADYRASMRITEDLFDFLLPPPAKGQNRSADPENRSAESCGKDPWDFLRPPFIRLRMDDAFERYAGFRLSEHASVKSLAQQARRLNLSETAASSFDTWGIDDLYELIFVQAVEPALPQEKPVFLTDYPAFVPCLAKDVPGTENDKPLWKERWELYACGIELANCYTEETDAEKVRAYFESERRLKEKNALVVHKTDTSYWELFRSFPPCSGVAMGADRLIALLSGRKSIEPVLPFSIIERPSV